MLKRIKQFYGACNAEIKPAELKIIFDNLNEAEQKLENLAEEIKEQILNFGYKVDDVHITKQKLS